MWTRPPGNLDVDQATFELLNEYFSMRRDVIFGSRLPTFRRARGSQPDIDGRSEEMKGEKRYVVRFYKTVISDSGRETEA